MRSGATRDRADDAGLSLVEVMVAMAVFVIGSLSLLSVLSTSASGTFDNRARLTAANLAASDIDEARSASYYDLHEGVTTKDVDVDGRTYVVTREIRITWAAGTSATSSCVASGSSRQQHKRISTAVTTGFRGSAAPVRADTIVKAPVFDPNSPRGAIGFLVMDRRGSPVVGVPVAVAGAPTRNTDANGCSFFDGLMPQNHVVTVTKPGAVTRLGSSTLTRTVAVNAGQITSESMRIDTGITVTVKAQAFTGTNVASGTWHMPQQRGLLTSPDRATPESITLTDRKTLTGAPLVWTAFPNPAGYEAHIGACSVKARFDSEPSTSPSVDLPFSTVTVHLRSSNKPKVQSKSVTATWVPASGAPACTEVITWSTVTSGECSGDADLNGNSCRLSLAVPAGRWTFTVSEAGGLSSASVGATPSPVPVPERAAPPTVEIQVT